MQGGYAKSVESFGYATEMNPKLKGKKTPLLPTEPVEEYIPPAFNASEVSSKSWASLIACICTYICQNCRYAQSW